MNTRKDIHRVLDDVVTDEDIYKALDELKEIAEEANELANAFMRTGNTNMHFKLSRFAFRVHDRCDLVRRYIVRGKRE